MKSKSHCRWGQIDMTQGGIVRQLIRYTIPLLLGDILQQFYNTADSVIVGNWVGKQALAAIGATSYIINMLIGLFVGISTGATVVISRYFGARRKNEMIGAIRTTLWITVTLGLVCSAVGVTGVPFILRATDTPADVYEPARLYLTIYFAGISSLIMYNMCAGILRAMGDSKRPLHVLAFSAVLNIALDLLFVLQYSMGITGAALATVISQLASAMVLLRIVIKSTGLKLLERPHIWREPLAEIIGIGLPVGLQQILVSLSNSIVVSYINWFGSGATAAWSIHVRFDHIIQRTVQTISMATTTFVAQNTGAHKPERIKSGVRTALLIALFVTLIYAALLIWLRVPLIRLFNQEKDVLCYGETIMMVMPLPYIINTVTIILAGKLRGQGNSRGPTAIMIGCYVLIRQMYLYIVWRHIRSFSLVMLCFPVTWLISAILMSVYSAIRENHPTPI